MVFKRKVLVVDDESLIVELCQRFLSSAGYEIKTVFRGDDAISLCQKEAFDLVYQM